MKWQDLGAEERLKVVEMANTGEVRVSELCRAFGVSRGTLRRARDKAEAGALQALERKPAGRPRKPAEEARIAELEKENESLREEMR